MRSIVRRFSIAARIFTVGSMRDFTTEDAERRSRNQMLVLVLVVVLVLA